jgi:hypothetical protein
MFSPFYQQEICVFLFGVLLAIRNSVSVGIHVPDTTGLKGKSKSDTSAIWTAEHAIERELYVL